MLKKMLYYRAIGGVAMKNKHYNKLALLRLQHLKYYVKGNHFIKYSPTGIEVLKRIEENIDNITPSLYALPDSYILDSYGIPVAFETPYYRNHKMLFKVMKNRVPFNKDAVVDNLIRALVELRDLNITYWDIHSGNILLDNNSDFKLVDLDGAEINASISVREQAIANYIDTLVEIYFEISGGTVFYLNSLLDNIKLDEYYSKEFVEKLLAIKALDREIIDYDLYELAEEFRDPNKVSHICRELDKKKIRRFC